MNEYIFYTSEGFTQSPTNENIENAQILGFEKGIDSESAKKTLLLNNSWILERGYSFENICWKQIFSNE